MNAGTLRFNLTGANKKEREDHIAGTNPNFLYYMSGPPVSYLLLRNARTMS